MNLMMKIPAIVCLLIGIASAVPPPRLRPSPYFGNLLGMEYAGIDDLGNHNYEGTAIENNALIYTARAGYIDMGHLRESADRARYIYEICLENLQKENTEFKFQVIEPAEYLVSIDYPSDWDELPSDEKLRIIREISIDLGQHYAHLSTIWHEIISWFGYSSTGLFSEKTSSFSWEDSYSDLLGTVIAAKVLRANSLDYNLAMTALIKEEITKLDPQPRATAEKATSLIYNKWYSGRYPFVSMNKRNFDVGFDDDLISPFRVPGICPDSEEIPCAVPPVTAPKEYGFKIRLTMTPREREKDQVLNVVSRTRKKTLIPEYHFPKIIEHIRKQAIKESGKDVDKPIL